MKPFLSEDFLLDTDTAKRLYFDCAKDLPIFDWHCHIPPAEIAENRQFDNLAQLWLGGDHYKWRAMRLSGVDERLITGDADDREKFGAWAETLPRLIGNPLYVWSHMELRRCFGIDRPLDGRTAGEVWEQANRRIAQPDFRARGILKKFRVKALFTTDDPADSLSAHRALRDDAGLETKVLPVFRPDKALQIERPSFAGYMAGLGEAAGLPIRTPDDLKQALRNRIGFFASMGCRASDQSVTRFPGRPAGARELDGIFGRALDGEAVSDGEAEAYRTALLGFLAEEYAARGWVMELHIGALRNCNTRMFRAVGPDTGFDAMADDPVAAKLSRFLDSLAVTGKLPKTVLFPLDPAEYGPVAALAGAFSEETDGKVQLGPAWWFNDHRDGMETQLKAYADLNLLANFVGMVTDSRSFLSYPRHEYFRRVLCNVLGGWVENGEYPADFDALGRIVSDICLRNAERFFGL